MSRFEGKVALVTGGSSGIGAATAARLEREGARVFTSQRGGSEHEEIRADFSDPAAPEHVMDEFRKMAGQLDILVNNAGIMREGTVEEISEEDWQLQIQVNLTVPFLLIRHAMAMLRETSGSIVNIGSIEGLGSNPRHPAYCASKAGLHGLTRAVAVDHGPDGVRCNAVAPGWIDTPLNEEFIDSQPESKKFRTRIAKIHPLRRTGIPEDVARLVCWLASNESGFVTGQVFTVDGGRTAGLSLP